MPRPRMISPCGESTSRSSSAGEVASGTTGRNHCLLHSGGRYCVNDEEAGIECIDENLTLRKIMPDILELNDGLFVATAVAF